MSATHPDATVDHALPYSKDGSNRSVNLLLSCDACNGARGNVSLTRFMKRMEKAGYAVRRDCVEAAIQRIESNKLCRRSACAKASGFTSQEEKKVRGPARGARPHTKAQRGPSRRQDRITNLIPRRISGLMAQGSPGRSRIDIVEELAWALAA